MHRYWGDINFVLILRKNLEKSWSRQNLCKFVSIIFLTPIFIAFKKRMYICIRGFNIYIIQKNILNLTLIMCCLKILNSIPRFSILFKENLRNYFWDFFQDDFHFFECESDRRKSDNIRTPQPVHHFGIYHQVVSRYAGHAISRCVSFAFPWK